MAATICKFRCESCEPAFDGDTGRRVVLATHYDEALSKEDASFSKATPSGRFEARIDNPTALDAMQFEPGKTYYITISTERQ